MKDNWYSTVFKTDETKVSLFDGSGPDVYEWLSVRDSPNMYEVYNHNTGMYLSADEFYTLHRPEPGAGKLDRVTQLVMAAMQQQASTTYHSGTTEGLDLVAVETAKQILKIL